MVPHLCPSPARCQGWQGGAAFGYREKHSPGPLWSPSPCLLCIGDALWLLCFGIRPGTRPWKGLRLFSASTPVVVSPTLWPRGLF